MNIQVESTGPCRKKLNIEVPVEEVDRAHGDILATYAKAAQIPGFRRGRAPENLVKKRYAKDIGEDLKSRLISENYHAALKQEKIDPVNVLDVDGGEVEPGKVLRFSVTVDVPPEFELPAYRGISLKGSKVDITDDMVRETMDDLRERVARYEDIAGRPVQKGDLVQIDYEGVCEGKPVEECSSNARGLGQGKDFWVSADENAFLDGFEAGLIGAQVGDKREIKVDFKADFHIKELAGKQAVYAVTVKALREKKLPEVDEAFCKTFGEESPETLRERVRKDLLENRERQEKSRLKDEIAKHLLASVALDVPESEVQEETRNTVYDIVRYNTTMGLSREKIEEQKNEIFEAASRSATEKTKLRYILHRIAEKESIAATPDEINMELALLARRYRMTVRELEKKLKEDGGMDRLEEDVRLRKTSDFLLEQAEVKV